MESECVNCLSAILVLDSYLMFGPHVSVHVRGTVFCACGGLWSVCEYVSCCGCGDGADRDVGLGLGAVKISQLS